MPILFFLSFGALLATFAAAALVNTLVVYCIGRWGAKRLDCSIGQSASCSVIMGLIALAALVTASFIRFVLMAIIGIFPVALFPLADAILWFGAVGGTVFFYMRWGTRFLDKTFNIHGVGFGILVACAIGMIASTMAIREIPSVYLAIQLPAPKIVLDKQEDVLGLDASFGDYAAQMKAAAQKSFAGQYAVEVVEEGFYCDLVLRDLSSGDTERFDLDRYYERGRAIPEVLADIRIRMNAKKQESAFH